MATLSFPQAMVVERRLKGWARFCAWYWRRPTVIRRQLTDVRITGMEVVSRDHVEVTFTARDGTHGAIAMPRD